MMLYQFISTHLYGIYSETEQLKVLEVRVTSECEFFDVTCSF